jgi:stress response protein SCP2
VLNKNQLSDFVAGNEKSSFNMKKGGCVFLPEGEITELHVGLGWDLGENGTNYDLDAGCVELQDVDHDGDLDPMAYIYFGALTDDAGAIEGADDNISGAGDGDDETMKIHLQKVPKSIEAIAVCVSNYKKGGFANIKNAYMRLLSPGGHEYLKFSLTELKDCTKDSIIFCMLERSKKPAGWNVLALGHPADGNTVHAIKTDLWDATGIKNNKTPAVVADDSDDDEADVRPPPPPPTVVAANGVRGTGGAASRKRPQVTESAGCCTIM